MTKMGDIVSYELLDTDANVLSGGVTTGEEVPVLVVSVSDDGSYSGFAFLPSGVTEYVSVAAPEPAPAPAPAPTPAPSPGPFTPLIDPATNQTFDSEESTWKFNPETGEPLAPKSDTPTPTPSAPVPTTTQTGS